MKKIRRFTVELYTRSKTYLDTNIAHIPPYVLLMAEFQRVKRFSVSDHVLRNTAGFYRTQSSDCRTRQCRDVPVRETLRSPRHLHDRMSSEWRKLCWRWNPLWTNTARSWFYLESQPSSCRFLPVPRRPYPATRVR